MGFKTCSSCGGSGSYLGTESVYDPSGGYMYKTVSVSKRCTACSGSGGRWVADVVPNYTRGSGAGRSGGRAQPAKPVDNRTPEEKQRDFENGLAGLASLMTAISIAWYGVSTWNVAWYWPMMLAAGLAFVVHRQLTERFRIVLKFSTWLIETTVKIIGLAFLLGCAWIIFRIIAQ